MRLSFGIEALDRTLGGGLQPGLAVLAGQAGVGRTSMAVQLARSCLASHEGKAVAYFALGEPREAVMARMASQMTNVGLGAVLSGRLPPDAWDRLKAAADSLAGVPFFVADKPSQTPDDVRCGCQLAAAPASASGGLGLVIIDDVIGGLRRTEEALARREGKSAAAVKGLRDIARDFAVPLIATIRLRRCDRAAGPSLNDLPGDGAWQDAETIILLNHEEGAYVESVTATVFRNGGKDLVRVPLVRNSFTGVSGTREALPPRDAGLEGQADEFLEFS